jgi:hypothetical protein
VARKKPIDRGLPLAEVKSAEGIAQVLETMTGHAAYPRRARNLRPLTRHRRVAKILEGKTTDPWRPFALRRANLLRRRQSGRMGDLVGMCGAQHQSIGEFCANDLHRHR